MEQITSDDETVMLKTRKSYYKYLPILILGGISLVGIPLLYYVYKQVNNTTYFVTDQKLGKVFGEHNDSITVPLKHVSVVDVEQSLMGNKFDYGTVEVWIGNTEDSFVFENVSNPVEVQEKIVNARRAYEGEDENTE